MTTISIPASSTILDELLLAGTRAIERAVTRRIARRAATAARRRVHLAADERARDIAALMHTGTLPR
ncbi:hypothetical protein [Microbacterium dauci]|uniref:Uncharacterized protein n=1 Tax=Microbacterium dauci TaxID=3048008 RepID=A0ABT6ZGH7_9MICO|nr:hypothetical protein [Microbacterium sp. LX3-4]MDJ1115265.1 hypothetical protein [Microbacterium sp. LX3-4]